MKMLHIIQQKIDGNADEMIPLRVTVWDYAQIYLYGFMQSLVWSLGVIVFLTLVFTGFFYGKCALITL